MKEFQEYWQDHRGIKWHVKVVPRSDRGVDVYIGKNRNMGPGHPDSYPHIHAYFPDREGTTKFATITWEPGRGPETHDDLGSPEINIPGLNQYVLDLIANLGKNSTPVSTDVLEDAKRNLSAIRALKTRVEKSNRYNRQDWSEAVALSKQLQASTKQNRGSSGAYEQNRRELDSLFESLNRLKDEANKFYQQSQKNYQELKPLVERAVSQAKSSEDTRQTKQELIRLQKTIKEISLAGKERNELRTLLQTGFEYINRKQNDFAEKQKRNYQEIKPEVTKAVNLAKSAKDTRQASQELKQVQGKLKSINLSRQDRDELWGLIQQGFDAIKRSRDEHSAEQIRNEKWLHKQVWDCELEVKSTSDFRATKEKLKSVSQEVRQANLKREDRDKLKARLDDAFRVLKDRQDQEYKQRQETHKNKLREIIARKRASRTNLEDSIRKDERYVSELYDKYRKVRSGPKELEIKRSIDSKISQVNQRISSKREKIRSIDRDIIDLEYKLRA